MIFKILMIGHLLGDFYFQSGKLAKDKTQKAKCLLQHCGIYFLSILITIFIFTDCKDWNKMVISILAAGAVHGCIDFGKIKFQKKKKNVKQYVLFLTDQALPVCCPG